MDYRALKMGNAMLLETLLLTSLIMTSHYTTFLAIEVHYFS